jgi:endoglucanase
MKKITFLLSLMTSTLGFAQNLVTNGDFQTGAAAPWYNNAANVVDLGGGNFVNQANVLGAGNPWDVNLSQEVLLEDGKTYRFTFDAFTDAVTGSRTIVAGLGQTGVYSNINSYSSNFFLRYYY